MTIESAPRPPSTAQLTTPSVEPKVDAKKVVIKSAIRAGQGVNRYAVR